MRVFPASRRPLTPTLSPEYRGEGAAARNRRATSSRAIVLRAIVCAGVMCGLTGGVAGVRVTRGQSPPPEKQPSLTLEEPAQKAPRSSPTPREVVPLHEPSRTPATDATPESLAWWEPAVVRPLDLGSRAAPISLESIVFSTLRFSPQVRVLSDKAIVRRIGVDEANAKFDLRAFMETRFTDTSDPVGNLLTTGGASRYVDQNWYASSGVRRLTPTGAQVEASLREGYEQSNSRFFVPNPQGTAKLAVTVTQPLLNGAGRAYQTSTILLAEADAGAAHDVLARDLQTLLFDVQRTYWDLYVQRATLLQKRKLYNQAVRTLEELTARRDVDVLGSQIVRAEAAVARREAAMIRFATSVKNAESKLRALVNDPAFCTSAIELVPVQPPTVVAGACDLEESLTTALQFRPEINQSLKQIQSASIRTGIARNELLPVLNLVVGSYVYGLAGQGSIGEALGNQFDRGRPTYWTGLQFEMPLGNRAATARAKQRQVELRQLTGELQTVTANVRAEVEIAVREVTTLQREWESKARAVAAVQHEIDYLTARWRLLPGENQDAGVLLDDLLNAQERLAEAEFGYVTAQAASSVAFVQLQRATGRLLAYNHVAQFESTDNGLPSLQHFTPQVPRIITPAPPPRQAAERLPPVE